MENKPKILTGIISPYSSSAKGLNQEKVVEILTNKGEDTAIILEDGTLYLDGNQLLPESVGLDKVKQSEFDERYVLAEDGKGLSTNDYTDLDKLRVETSVTGIYPDDTGIKYVLHDGRQYVVKTPIVVYDVATKEELGLVKSGDIIEVAADGTMTIKNYQHTHDIQDVNGLNEFIDETNASIDGLNTDIQNTNKNLTDEITRSTTVDNGLSQLIEALQDDLAKTDEAVGDTYERLGIEINRATGVEAALRTDVNKAQEDILNVDGSIICETNRATAAEKALGELIKSSIKEAFDEFVGEHVFLIEK